MFDYPPHTPRPKGETSTHTNPPISKRITSGDDTSTHTNLPISKLFTTGTGVERKVVSSLKVIVRIKPKIGGFFSKLSLVGVFDNFLDLFGKSFLLELVSAENASLRVSGYAHRGSNEGELLKYEAKLKLPAEFGEVGAVFIENERINEMYVIDVVLEGFNKGRDEYITCHSWVDPKSKFDKRRVFFTNKSYLPSRTPEGLIALRKEELQNLRGNDQCERQSSDRVYDYDTYNDLGDPDHVKTAIEIVKTLIDELKTPSHIHKAPILARPVLGGAHHPYPRRCRTGRPKCSKDPDSEKRSSFVYVPRDEQFSEVKEAAFSAKALHSVLHAIIPSLESELEGDEVGFPHFRAIHSLFNEGIHLPTLRQNGLISSVPRLVRAIHRVEASILQFELPSTFDRDNFAWCSDEDFSRQTLAGLNPYSIKLVTEAEWPLSSKLEASTYGPQNSEINAELVEQAILGYAPGVRRSDTKTPNLDKALKENRLFMLDYHDAFLPYVNVVRKLENTTLYGSRTLFILTETSTTSKTPEISETSKKSQILRPLVIELTRPLDIDEETNEVKLQWKQAFTKKLDATSSWLWRFAKAHVLAHDAAYHQLISHWLRTHCCTEPYIIATKRQLSAMHPIHRLLHPHFRYTMEINALARQSLINANGIIESTFSPGMYSIEMSSAIYKSDWRFDQEALPADLIKRGMAYEDENHGLTLRIDDYPFAKDGLELWDILKQWTTDYINHYYLESDNPESSVKLDEELQAWWTEIRTVGHGDKKDEPWWPKLETPEDLIQIVTTMIWVSSGHHAAVNFGQYDYGGYFPNRPTLIRKNMPTEDPTEESWNSFSDKPVETLLKSFPSKLQATKVMAVLDVLSSHSPEEEYIGKYMEPAYEENAEIRKAFLRFRGSLHQFGKNIDARNKDATLKNRNGAGVVPYELLKPVSGPGVTSMGVPNSISI